MPQPPCREAPGPGGGPQQSPQRRPRASDALGGRSAEEAVPMTVPAVQCTGEGPELLHWSDADSCRDCIRWDSQPGEDWTKEGPAVELVELRQRRTSRGPSGSTDQCRGKAPSPQWSSEQENQERQALPKEAGRPLTGPRVVDGRLDQHYRLEPTVLGTGVSGQVRLAVCCKTGRRVAVKSFDRLSMTKKQWEEALDEVRVHMALDHPHVAELLWVYVGDDIVHLVMECLEGGELFSHLAVRKRLSEAEAADVAQQVLRAVAYLHAHCLVHGDLKLENLIFESKASGHLKLVDFGHSQRLSGAGELTRACGTLQYMAPEVVAGSYTEKADLWSVGVLLSMLLLGRHLYSGSPQAIRRKVAAGMPDYSLGFKGLSDGAQGFLQSLLAVDPAQRLTASAALQHPWLRSFASSVGTLDQSLAQSLGSLAASPQREQAGLLVPVPSQPPKHQDHAALRQQFHALDADGDGVITLSDLSRALMAVPGANASFALANLDINGSGKVTWSAYLGAMLRQAARAKEDSNGAYVSSSTPAAKWRRSVRMIARVTLAYLQEAHPCHDVPL
uniref:Non-specific serine/threonine protein kinase n=1 Tax=Alexandrium monilatum TaxID=311494 RepID=A0A7S4QIP1_9DINO